MNFQPIASRQLQYRGGWNEISGEEMKESEFASHMNRLYRNKQMNELISAGPKSGEPEKL